MRSKTILSATAFILAFAASAAFASLFITEFRTETKIVSVSNYPPTSCFSYLDELTTADKIAALICQDHQYGRASGRRKHLVGNGVRPPFGSPAFSGYAAAVGQYVNASSSLYVNDLPEDFQIKWNEHMRAWHGYEMFLCNVKKHSNLKNLSDDELKKIADSHNDEVNRTWREVLKSGRSYGASVY